MAKTKLLISGIIIFSTLFVTLLFPSQSQARKIYALTSQSYNNSYNYPHYSTTYQWHRGSRVPVRSYNIGYTNYSYNDYYGYASNYGHGHNRGYHNGHHKRHHNRCRNNYGNNNGYQAGVFFSSY
ncbi:MAG: hypothetical protein AB1782_03840 [Cyanobacteriota bacterium]